MRRCAPRAARFGQRIGNASADPDRGGFLDAELHGDGVGGLEADSANIARQAVGVLRHHLDGVGTVGLENPYRPRGADAVAVQEHHAVLLGSDDRRY
jgi:hypothetical protein